MNVYPIMLKVQGRRAVVVGGGAVGLRKARGLRDAGAEVVLVAERLGEEMDLEHIDVRRRAYRTQDVAGAALVFACTNDRHLNAQVAIDARAVGALVNAADQPVECDFFAPAVVRRGEVVIAVGTGGDAPSLAKELARRIDNALPERLGEFAEALGRLRKEVAAAVPDDAPKRMAVSSRLAGDDGHRAFLKGGLDALRAMMDELIREDGTENP